MTERLDAGRRLCMNSRFSPQNPHNRAAAKGPRPQRSPTIA